MNDSDGDNASGLHAPGAAIGSLEPPRRWSAGRIAFQSLGFMIAAGLLLWALRLALSEENRDCIDRLRHAEAWRVALLFGLSAVAVIISASMFWVVIRPERRVAYSSILGANAIAMGLGLVPLKLGMVARVLVHHRRDGVPFKDIVAWIAAMAALSIVSLGPLALAGVWRREVDALWWIIGIGGALAGHAAGVILGRAAETRPLLARLSLGSWRMVRHPSGVAAHAALRLTDLALLGVRFWLAASMAGVALTPGQAMLFGVVYVTLVVGGPMGRIGFAEAAVAGVAYAIGQDARAMTLVAITVTAAEALTSLGAAAIACLWIRPDRLMARRDPTVSAQS